MSKKRCCSPGDVMAEIRRGRGRLPSSIGLQGQQQISASYVFLRTKPKMPLCSLKPASATIELPQQDTRLPWTHSRGHRWDRIISAHSLQMEQDTTADNALGSEFGLFEGKKRFNPGFKITEMVSCIIMAVILKHESTGANDGLKSLNESVVNGC
ncbi:hypothetical protein AV530_009402 [Patagioenas fasciata monilis]|uniref:Uncharacterized protein n=1 Tax=Patagioenas fasciata monilis TaxID=372326 RepID=A0A1V4JJ32_PATFA|nr:hypothetical protein AV530_009402 [Patagioenas fasciata monilis]